MSPDDQDSMLEANAELVMMSADHKTTNEG